MESIALYDQVSQIISAVESTTLFTSITPRLVPQTDAPDGVLPRPTVTVTSESTAEGAEDHNGSGIKFIGAVEIAIAFAILGEFLATQIFSSRLVSNSKHSRRDHPSRERHPLHKTQKGKKEPRSTATDAQDDGGEAARGGSSSGTRAAAVRGPAARGDMAADGGQESKGVRLLAQRVVASSPGVEADAAGRHAAWPA